MHAELIARDSFTTVCINLHPYSSPPGQSTIVNFQPLGILISKGRSRIKENFFSVSLHCMIENIQ